MTFLLIVIPFTKILCGFLQIHLYFLIFVKLIFLNFSYFFHFLYLSEINTVWMDALRIWFIIAELRVIVLMLALFQIIDLIIFIFYWILKFLVGGGGDGREWIIFDWFVLIFLDDFWNFCALMIRWTILLIFSVFHELHRVPWLHLHLSMLRNTIYERSISGAERATIIVIRI